MEEVPTDYFNIYDTETIKYLEEEFTLLKDNFYLDHAASTLYSKSQIKNVSDDLCSSLYGNPHSLGNASKYTSDLIEQMRFRVLDHFNTNSDEYSVVFTSSATDSLKLISESFNFSNSSDENGNGHFVYLQDNHTSVLGMREVVSRRGAKVLCLTHDRAFQIFRSKKNQQIDTENSTIRNSNSLFVYSAQCNFSGLKYPLAWIKKVNEGNALDRLVENEKSKWFVLLDAAGYVATNDLDLKVYKPDFVCLSFYKMFGYPTGLGALLVKNSSQDSLKKIYYGGGTVDISLSLEMFHSKRSVLHERFEDGTLPFLTIISLRHGFEALNKISSKKISQHVFYLAKYLHDSLLRLHHENDTPVAILYGDTDYDDEKIQGGIVTFNLLRSNGEYVGFVEFLNIANLHKIHVRTGCFCNPGACQRHLKLSNEELKENFNAGHVCGDERDLINGKPTGAIRISFGYMSKKSEVDALLKMIKKCFLDGSEVEKVPEWWKNYKIKVKKKYCDENVEVFDKSQVEIDQKNINTKNFNENLNESLQQEEEVNNENKKYCKLKKLFIYPVKSCAAYEIQDSWIIGNKGLIYDREWMIVTASGVCLTQKHETKLCLIRPTIKRAENILELNFSGMPSIKIPLKIATSNDVKTGGNVCRSKICGHRVEGIDCGADVSEWLSLTLRRPGLRLVRQINEEIKMTKSPEISFASQAQYLLINQASIKWLGEKISDNSECDKETILNRFRGNMVVEGCEPFQEMKWMSARIGETRFKVDGQCTRCQMICIDQNTGEKTVEPLRTLAEEFHGKMKFGIYLSRAISQNAVIKIGDQVFYE